MRARIVRQRRLAEGRFLIELEVPQKGFAKAAAGQFVHVRIEDSCDPLLRRPFSIHDIVSSSRRPAALLKIVYEVVGKGTELLSQKAASACVDILGPLGSGFDIKAIGRGGKVALVAGGMGVAPLYFLAKRLVEVGCRKSDVGRPIVLIGAKTKAHLLGEKMFKDLGCRVAIATDDGSKGFKGFVTALLEDRLSAMDDGPWTVCACGPKPMLAAVAAVAAKHAVPAYVSLEEFMGCGLGACLGCAIKTASGYRRICHDGPVFDSREIIWESQWNGL